MDVKCYHIAYMDAMGIHIYSFLYTVIPIFLLPAFRCTGRGASEVNGGKVEPLYEQRWGKTNHKVDTEKCGPYLAN